MKASQGREGGGRFFKLLRDTRILFALSALTTWNLNAATDIVVTLNTDAASATGGTFTTPSGGNDLRGALNYINTQPSDTYNISFQVAAPSISLTTALPPLNFPIGGTSLAANHVTIDGSNTLGMGGQITINGGMSYRPFYAYQGTVALQNMTLLNCAAVGGAGGAGGGGGGAGLGGALFIDQAAVTVTNVAFTNSKVQAGAGGAVNLANSGGGGGGGMAGNGGAGGANIAFTVAAGGGGGGGGLSPTATGGNGGNNSANFGGGGGGGGAFGAGGNGSDGNPLTSAAGGGGGGYGGTNATGGNGTASNTPGNPGGSGGAIATIPLGGGGGSGGNNVGPGGSGGSSSSPCTSSMTAQGGSGGGSSTSSFPCVSATGDFGTNGGLGGGGGGGGGGDTNAAGGDGGLGGGGGGAIGNFPTVRGGMGGYLGGGGGNSGAAPLLPPDGGFGGGGGGISSLTNTIPAGSGGFGGGGGGCANILAAAHTSGGSGFGGGAGGLNGNTHAGSTRGVPGIGGGIASATAATSGGGSGGAMGAVIFVNAANGGSLTVETNSATGSTATSTTGSTAVSASGAGTSGQGYAQTSAGFIQEILVVSGTSSPKTIYFQAVQSNDTVTINQAIADDGLASIPNQGIGAGNTPGNGIGANVVINPTGGQGKVIFNSIHPAPAPPNQSNTYSGSTTIAGGTLNIWDDASLGSNTAAPLIFSGNGALQIAATINPLSATRTLTLNDGVTATLDTNGFNLTYSGNPSFGLDSALTKAGTGTLTLNGNNTTASASYTVQAGTLVLGAVGNPLNTYQGLTTINSGATLQGGTANTLSSGSQHLLNGTGALNLNGVAQTIGSLASASASSTVTLGAGTLTAGGDHSTTLFAGSIGGAGGVTKTGAGQMTLSGASNYMGTTLVQGGILSVTGSVTSPVAVQSGATLKGTGTIGNSVTVDGNIQPGTSIGTLTVSSLTLNPNAITTIEFDPNQTSVIAVNGNATQDGSLQLIANPGTYGIHRTLDFVTATGTISGTFSSISVPTGFLVSQITYNPQVTSISLTYVPSIGAGVPLSPNERALLSYLQGLVDLSQLTQFLLGLGNLSASELIAALDSMNPARNAASTYVLSQAALSIATIDLNHLAQGRMQSLMKSGRLKKPTIVAALEEKQESLLASADDPVAMGKLMGRKKGAARKPAEATKNIAAEEARNAIWVDGFGDFISQNAQNQNPKFHNTSYGVILGYDRYGAENGMFTISGGSLHNDIRESGNAGSGTSNGGILSIYGTGFKSSGNFYGEAGILAGYSRFKMKRNVSIGGATPFNETARSAFNVWTIIPHLGFGYDAVYDWCVIEPFASADCSVNFQSKYSETGASLLNMTVKSSAPMLIRSQAGCNFYQIFDTETSLCILNESISYMNKAPINTNMTATLVVASASPGFGGAFNAFTYNKNLSLFAGSFEVFYKHKPSRFFLSATYDGEIGSGYRSNVFQGAAGRYF